MSQHPKNYFLTLVCAIFLVTFSVHAAPSSESIPDPIGSGLHGHPEEPSEPTRAELRESTQITPVPVDSALKEAASKNEIPLIPTRRLAEEATFITLGLWMGAVTDNSGTNSLTYFRLGKSLYTEPTFANEYTLDLSSSGNIGWSTGYKFIQDLGRFYEPYLKIALAGFYQPSEGIGTLINWQRYQIHGEMGCDDLLERDRRLRAELGFSWSGFGAGIYFGAAFAF